MSDHAAILDLVLDLERLQSKEICSKEVVVEQNSGMWIAASTISLLEFLFYSFFSTFPHAEGRLSSFMNSEMEQIRVQCVLDLYFVKLTSSATY